MPVTPLSDATRSQLAGAADHRRRDPRQVGFEREDVLSGGHAEHGPAGSVVDPLVGEDVASVDAEGGHDLSKVRLIELTGRHQRRSNEAQPVLVAANLDQAGNALLHNAIRPAWFAAVVQPGARQPPGGVPGKG